MLNEKSSTAAFVPGKKYTEIMIMLIMDILGFAIATGLVTIVRYFLFRDRYTNLFDPQVVRTLLSLVIFTILVLGLRGLYPGWGRSSAAELKQILETVTIVYIITAMLIYVVGTPVHYSRSIFLLTWFFAIIILPIGRFTARKLIARADWWGEPVVIIGLEGEIREMYDRLVNCPRLGLRPVAGLAADAAECEKVNERFTIHPWSRALQDELTAAGVQTNVLAISTNQLQREYPEIFTQLEMSFKKTIFILDKDVFSIMMAQPVDLAGQPAIISRHSLLEPSMLLAKQVSELAFLVVILLPVALIGGLVSLLIKLDSPGPVFFQHERVGRFGKTIRVYKFRTMVVGAGEALDEMLKDPARRLEWDTYHKFADDPRITRVGKWVRKFSLDELPQIINILRGEMTLIGPRPLVQAEIDEMGDAAPVILRVRPGVTGWWQVMGRNNLSFEERTRLDLYYVYNWSLWLDLFIFIKTFWVVAFER